jgi:hypothetical protein
MIRGFLLSLGGPEKGDKDGRLPRERERKAKGHGVLSVTVVLIFAEPLRFTKLFLKLTLFRLQYRSLLNCRTGPC